MGQIEKAGELRIEPSEGYPEGERYLRMLGLEELIGQTMPSRNLPWESFPEICGDGARKFLAGMEHSDPNSPQYAVMLDYARGFVRNHIEQQTEQS